MPSNLAQTSTSAVATAAVATLALLLAACGEAPPPGDVRTSEMVWCADEDGALDTVSWQGHDGTLTAPAVEVVELERTRGITAEDLVAACSPRRTPAEYTVCEAYAPLHEVREIAERADITIHGEFTDSRPGVATVIRGAVDCTALTLDPPHVIYRLRPWDAGVFDTARQVERDLAAAAHDCLDLDTARALALEAREKLTAAATDRVGGAWPVVEFPYGTCYDIRLTRLAYIAVEPPHESPLLPTG
jgi:hypothetical protein